MEFPTMYDAQKSAQEKVNSRYDRFRALIMGRPFTPIGHGKFSEQEIRDAFNALWRKCHVSPWYVTLPENREKYAGKLIYIANENDLMRDRWTILSPGKIFQRIGAHEDIGEGLCGIVAQEWASRLQPSVVPLDEWVLEITDDPETIREWYAEGESHGIHSCMSEEDDEDNRGSPGLLAYGKPGDTAMLRVFRHGKYCARAIFRVPTREFPRLYVSGRERILEGDVLNYLQTQGYTCNNFALDGAKLRLVWREKDETVYVPYVDGAVQSADICGNFLVIRKNGDLQLTETCGYVDVSPYRCEHCNERLNEDEICYAENDGPYCESCYGDLFSYCEMGEHSVPCDDIVEIRSRCYSYACQSCAEHEGYVRVEDDSTWYPLDDVVPSVDDVRYYHDYDYPTALDYDGVLWVCDRDETTVEAPDGTVYLEDAENAWENDGWRMFAGKLLPEEEVIEIVAAFLSLPSVPLLEWSPIFTLAQFGCEEVAQ